MRDGSEGTSTPKEGLKSIIKQRGNVFILLLGLLGSILIAISIMKYGPGITHASVNNISSSVSLVENFKLEQFDGRTFHEYGPLYPLLMAPLILIGIDPVVSAGIINLITFGLIVVVTTKILNAMGLDPWMVILGGSLILFSKPIFQVSIMAWDTPIFILFTALFIRSMSGYLSEGGRKKLVFASVFAALALLSNFDGIVLMVAGSMILLTFGKKGIGSRIKDTGSFALISFSPFFLYLMRNLALTGSLIGEKGESAYSISKNFLNLFISIGNWFVPGFVPFILTLLFVFIFIGILATITLSFMKKNEDNDLLRMTVLISSSILAIFIPYLLVTRSLVSLGAIDTKITAPMYPLTILVLFAGIGMITERGPKGIFRIFQGNDTWIKVPQGNVAIRKRIGITLIVLWSVLSMAIIGLYCMISIVDGAGGYNTVEWRESELMRSLEDLDLEGEVYSNSPDAIYLILDQENIDLLPRKTAYSSSEPTNDLEDLENVVAREGNATVIWFEKGSKGYLYDIDEIEQNFDFEEILRADDGVILRIYPKEGGE